MVHAIEEAIEQVSLTGDPASAGQEACAVADARKNFANVTAAPCCLVTEDLDRETIHERGERVRVFCARVENMRSNKCTFSA